MAYNVLKGVVEGSVDQHADQEIDGVKIFKNTVSAARFYDTDAQSPCATENNVAIEKLLSDNEYGVLTYHGNKIAKSNHNLRFDGKVLMTDKAVIKSLSGSGAGLKDVPAQHLSGKVAASSIEYGLGLEDKRGNLKVKISNGIMCDQDGVAIDIGSNSGLDFKNKKLVVNPDNCLNIQEGGQNISDADLLLLYDSSRGQLRHSTLKNLYDGYVNLKAPHAAGNRNCIQFKGTKTFEASQDFTYEPTAKTLSVKGTTKTLNLQVSQNLESNNKLLMNGAVFKSIKMIEDKNYIVQDTDNTLLFNTSKNNIVATLPAAKENSGRVLIIKKVCHETDKYKISNTHSLKIKSDEELIDFSNELILKSNYSVRTVQSDGNKWWIINKSGS